MIKFVPPALLTACVLAPAAQAADTVSAVLECTQPADKALAALKAAGIALSGSPVPVSATAYGVPVKAVTGYQNRDELGLTYTVASHDLPTLIKAAKAKKWEDESGAGAHRDLLGKRNALNTAHPDDIGTAPETDIECRMSFGGAL